MSMAETSAAKKEIQMTIDKAVFVFAGLMILLSLALTHFVSPWVWRFTAFIGLNMAQAGFTGFCPAAMILKKLGIRPGCAFN
jgi:hypothetical protein